MNFIIDNFDKLFNSEESLKKLEEIILDLAVKGKLVQQDPNDEPASVLLEKIKAEKEQLIKDKKIKKDKDLAPITEEEIPFEIPESWEWVRLGNVAGYIQRGKSPEYSEIEVTPLTLTPNRAVPHATGIANALKYDLYINNEGVYEEVVITEQKTGGLQWVTGTSTVTSYTPISNPFNTLFLTELTIGSKLYTNTGTYIGKVKTIVSDTELTVEETFLDSDSSNYCYSNSNYFINPTNGSVFNFPSILPKTGTIVTLTSSDIITGTSTNFTSLNVQDKVYTDAGILIGRISSITSDTQIRLYGNALVAYSGIFKTQSAVTSK